MAKIKDQLAELNKMSKKSVAVYHKIALSLGLSDSSLGILYALLEAESPCSQYDLCNEWFIPKQTINSAVTALKKKGFLSLVPVQGTRNRKNIVLTDAGREFTQKTIGRLRDAELCALAGLTSEEREQYIRLNRIYNQSLIETLDRFPTKTDQGGNRRAVVIDARLGKEIFTDESVERKQSEKDIFRGNSF